MHVRGAIADVAGKCPYTDDGAVVLCERIQLLLRKVWRETVDVDIGYPQLAWVGFRRNGSAGRLRINLNPGKRMR